MADEIRERARKFLEKYTGNLSIFNFACAFAESEAALARKQEREECAKAVCLDCKRNQPKQDCFGVWIHTFTIGTELCDAARIHARNREEKG